MKNIKKQIEENPIEKYGGLTRKDLKEAVDYVFKTDTKKKVLKKDKSQPYLSVYQDEDENTLSFIIKNSSGTYLKTGLGGFINMFNQEGGSLIVLYPVNFNGQLLNEEATEAFWEEFSKIKETYECNNK